MESIQIEHEWRNGYKVVEVFGSMSERQRQDVLHMWASEHAVQVQEAQRRVHQVACLILDPQGAVCGVSTAYLDVIKPGGHSWYLMRMFIRKNTRGLAGYPSIVSRVTRKLLARVSAHKGNLALGTAIVTENPGLWKKGMHKKFERSGWVYQEKLPNGQEIWVCPFKGEWAANE